MTDRLQYTAPLGHSVSAHRVHGWCAIERTADEELIAWRTHERSRYEIAKTTCAASPAIDATAEYERPCPTAGGKPSPSPPCASSLTTGPTSPADGHCASTATPPPTPSWRPPVADRHQLLEQARTPSPRKSALSCRRWRTSSRQPCRTLTRSWPPGSPCPASPACSRTACRASCAASSACPSRPPSRPPTTRAANCRRSGRPSRPVRRRPGPAPGHERLRRRHRAPAARRRRPPRFCRPRRAGAGVDAGEDIEQLRARLREAFAREGAQLGDVREERIARTEAGRAWNTATLGAARDATGTPAPIVKQWLSRSDDRVRRDHAEANGQIQFLDEPFTVGGIEMDAPHDPTAPASQMRQLSVHPSSTPRNQRICLRIASTTATCRLRIAGIPDSRSGRQSPAGRHGRPHADPC